MDERPSGLWIVMLVAFAGLFHVVPGSNVTEQRTASTVTQSRSTQKPAPSSPADDIALGLIAEHFQITGDSKDIPKYFRDKAGKVVIALAPDPIDNRGAYRFDEAIAMLQAGVQSAGYLLDRFSLPWPRKSANAAETDKTEPAFRLQPGAMIFRATGFPSGSLLVLLVGEIPTGGVHKTALFRALDLAYTLSSDEERKRLQIIGPSFSGSVPSIKLVTKNWISENKRAVDVIHFISGNSTSPDARRDLVEFKVEGAPLAIRYHATVLSDDVIQCAISDYLRKIRVRPQKVAVLSESDSAYGSTLRNACSGERPHRYWLPYPLEVSQVRTRYQAELAQEPAASVFEDPSSAALRLAADDAEDPRDKPQLYSAGPSANVAELSLAAIIQTLNHEHITHVGLFGTDTRDKLFLAQLIRTYFPNIQFFTDDADVLYAHPNFRAHLWGMLVFSTYPLVSQNMTWIRDLDALAAGNQLRQFSSQAGEAVYNAAYLAASGILLRPDSVKAKPKRYWMVENPLVEGKRALPDHYYPLHPRESGLPVAWITVVGNSSLWPLAIYDPWDNTPDGNNIRDAVNIQQSRPYLILVFILSALCLANVYYYELSLDPSRSKRPTYSVFEGLSRHKMFKETTVPKQQSIVILGYFGLLLVLYFIVAQLALIPVPYIPLAASELSVAITAVLLLLVTTLTGSALVYSLIHAVFAYFGVSVWRFRRWIGVALVAGIATAVLTTTYAAPAHMDLEKLMLYERASRAASGVSPVLPVLFFSCGIAIWLLCLLKRGQLVPYSQRIVPFIQDGKGESAKGFFALHRLIRKAMIAPFAARANDPRAAILLAVSLTIYVAALWGGFFKTVEFGVWDFNVLLWFFSIALVTGLFWTAMDFLIIQYHLLRLLRKLTFHPLAAAFDRLPDKCSRGLSTNLLESAPTLVELQEPYGQLVEIRNKLDSIGPGLTVQQRAALPQNLAGAADDIADALKTEMIWAGSDKIQPSAIPSETQCKLSKLAAHLFELLKEYWEGSLFQDTENGKTKEAAAVFKLCENFVALQIVAYLNGVFIYLRYLLFCSGAGLVLLLLATSTYPYLRQNIMMNFAWLLVLLFSATYLYTVVNFDRNPIIRSIRTQEGKAPTFNRSLISQAFLFGMIPLLTFLGAKFPALGKLIFVWVGPLMKSLNL